MKATRQATIILFSALMILSLILPAFAGVIDCRDVSKEERDAVGANETDSVIRFYNGSFLHGFANGDRVEVLTGSDFVLEEILVSFRSDDYGSVACYRLKDSVAEKLDGLESEAAVFAQYTDERTIDKLEQKTKSKIQSIVCLSGESSHDGIFICYQTDNGDYILYKEYATAEKVYFFPLGDFYDVAKDYYELKMTTLYDKNGEVRKGASVRFEDVGNVKRYELSLDDTVIYGIIICAAVGAAIVVFVVIITKIRRAARSREHA